MPMSDSLRPLPAPMFGFEQARHLLWRSGFGGTRQQIDRLAGMGLERAVDLVVNFRAVSDEKLDPAPADPDLLGPPTPQLREMMQAARESDDPAVRDRLRAEQLRRRGEDRQVMAQIQSWWLARMIASPRPFEESLTLLWHNHFATSFRSVRNSYLMYQQNEMFRAHAMGSFADLLRNIVRDPAMIRYLNNDRNIKRSPNENLARELMELFSLGEGNYTERDIKEGARALTGYGRRHNDFEFRSGQHDSGQKHILGRTGEYDGDDFVEILLRQEVCPIFIAYKIYRHFVADVDVTIRGPQRTVIRALADELRKSDYALEPPLRTLLTSRHFYDPRIVGNKIKSPVQLIVGAVRSLGTPTRDIAMLSDAAAQMGQQLFAPPSVAGWAGGRSWINTSTLFVRQNLTTFLLSGKLPYDDHWDRGKVDYDPTPLLQGVDERSAERVVDHLMPLLFGQSVAAGRREQFVSFLDQRGASVSRDRLLGLLLMMTSTPEYQLC